MVSVDCLVIPCLLNSHVLASHLALQCCCIPPYPTAAPCIFAAAIRRSPSRHSAPLAPSPARPQVLASSIAAEFTNAAEGLLPESGAGVADVEALE